MKERIHGRQNKGRLTGLIAAFAAAVLLAAVPVAAQSTVTGSDVMIRNSAEEKNGDKNNIIGSLNEGDKVTVKSKTTDASGQEWYFVELPNGNTGYVKADWVDVDGSSVETQPHEDTEQTQDDQKTEDERKSEDVQEAREETPADQAPVENDADDWILDDSGNQDAGDDSEDEGSIDNGDVQTDSGDEQTDLPDADDGQETPAVDNGDVYDPFKDPNAQYSINYVTEKDGTGNWYIFNYDTNKRIRLGDLRELSDAQASAQKNASSAGIWRTIACILLILVIVLLVLLYIILKRNSPGRGSAASRRSRRQRRTEEEDEDDDFYYTGEEGGKTGETGEKGVRPAAALKQDVPDEEDNEDAAEYDSAEEDSDEDPEDYDDLDEDSDEDDFDEDLMDDDDREDDDQLPRQGGVFGFFRNIFSRDGLDDDYDDEEDEEDGFDDDGFDDDVYEEDEIDYEEEADEEDEVPEEAAPVKKAKNRGRSFEETQAPAPRPRKRPARNISFDEALDYPEDEELLSAVGKTSGNRNEAADTSGQPSKSKNGAPAAEKTAKNPAAGRSTAASEDSTGEFFADDDDDMEYSFLNSPSRRSPK